MGKVLEIITKDHFVVKLLNYIFGKQILTQGDEILQKFWR